MLPRPEMQILRPDKYVGTQDDSGDQRLRNVDWRLVSGYGLCPDRASARGSFVFVCRHAETKPPEEEAVSAHA
jgi:hypothetical protein